MTEKYCNHHLLYGNRCMTCEREKANSIDHETLPLPEVVEIKPVNQFADKLYGMITGPAKDKLWSEPVKKASWKVEYER